MTIDIYAIRERLSRPYGWKDTTGAPEPVREAVATYLAALNDLDDALVEFEVEEQQRASALKKHNQAVTEALRAGKQPPAAKVPSLEDIEVRHGAIIGARETFVHEAAAVAERVAQEHYPTWRSDAVEEAQSRADKAAELMTAAAQAVHDWRKAAALIGRLDRNFCDRGRQFDSASLVRQVEIWESVLGAESSNMVSQPERYAARVRQLTNPPIITEYDPTGGPEQYSRAWLAEQSPAVQADIEHRATVLS